MNPMKAPADDFTDHELMMAVGSKDSPAFARLVERHLSWALSFVERMLGSRQDAEDLVQLAFLKVWQGAAYWEPQAKFRTWLYRVLHNLCMDHFRARGTTSISSLDDEIYETLVDEGPSVEDNLLRQERERRVQQALTALPPRQRAALVLCYYEDCSQAESAALLEISEGALESLLSRGRASLRKWLQADLQ
jgi:RNA polymerase sigma-70 factor, ECF subfamily